MTPQELAEELFAPSQRLLAATLSAPRPAAAADAPRKVTLKPVTLKGKAQYQFESQTGPKVKHENLMPRDARIRVAALLTDTYRQGIFHTGDADILASARPNGTLSVQRKAATKAGAPVPVGHDRVKNYIISEGQPCAFLHKLGVMSAEGNVVAAKRDKFKQINRFLEMVADIWSDLPSEGPLRVIDFGSGKSYLTFALYYFIHTLRGREVTMMGLDLKEELVAHSESIARELGYDGLRFTVGEIAGYQSDTVPDLVVSLHACDTATDDALLQAVAWSAKVILAVPCCQHELFKQIQSDSMAPLLKHGLFKERLSALVTDALRAEWLGAQGYTVQVLEFIESEHTAKNILLRAVKQLKPKDTEARQASYDAFRDFWHAAPHLDKTAR